MLNFLAIFLGKSIINFSQILNLGSGSTWPGHIALKINPNFSKQILKNSKTKVVVIAGTNGKTTTGRLITSIIRENNKTYLQNKAGANLINGLASTLIRGTSFTGKLSKDYLIFESDENALSKVLNQVNPDYIICLDLFRDQLDRYGEIDNIAKKWNVALKELSEKATLILNADDPQISYLSEGIKAKSVFFGLEEDGGSEIKHGADSTHCPKCFEKLKFSKVYFSHLGIWECPKCKLKRKKPNHTDCESCPLDGTYNKYNCLAASLFAKEAGFDNDSIIKAFNSFTPAFGRGEKLEYKNKKIQIFLSKNPTSFNESLNTIKELGGKNLLIILNDRIPDGLDVSWIWDINFEDILEKDMNIMISGDRVWDMSLRLKYNDFFTHHHEAIEKALDSMVSNLDENETLFILPNYSAMLDVRKIITGKKIL